MVTSNFYNSFRFETTNKPTFKNAAIFGIFTTWSIFMGPDIQWGGENDEN